MECELLVLSSRDLNFGVRGIHCKNKQWAMIFAVHYRRRILIHISNSFQTFYLLHKAFELRANSISNAVLA